jgi:hypothetical protein
MLPTHFPVYVDPNGVLPEGLHAPAVFHEVNKSGSLVMSDVIREGHRYARRADELF